jgi:hypothetical protein
MSMRQSQSVSHRLHINLLGTGYEYSISAGTHRKRKFTDEWISLLALLFGTSKSRMEATIKRPKQGGATASLTASFAYQSTVTKTSTTAKTSSRDDATQSEPIITHEGDAAQDQSQRDGFQGFPVANLKLRSGKALRAPAHLFVKDGILSGLVSVFPLEGCLCDA